MNFFSSNGLEPFPSQYLTQLERILKVLCVLQGVVGVLFTVMYLSNGFSLILQGMILFCIVRCKNLCMCMMYIFFTFQGLIFGLYYIGFIISTIFNAESSLSQSFVISTLDAPLNLVCTYYAFLYYKELKASFIENGQNAGLLQPQSRPQNEERRYFEGRGYRLD